MPELTRRNLLGATAAGAALFLPSFVSAQGLTPPPLPQGGGPAPPPLPQAAPVAPPPLPSGGPALPSFLQAGSRLIWYGSSASIPGERSQLEPDANGHWVNKATGQRYSENETAGPGGAGYVVMDVLLAGPGGILINFAQYLIHTEANNSVTFTDSNGLPSGVEAIGDFWVAPARLATVTDIAEGGTRVLHMPYVLGGHSYRAVRMQIQGGSGWSQTTFDLDTGIGLVSTSSAEGSPVLIRTPDNQIGSGAGSTLMTYSQFVGSRHTNLPGPGATFPDAIRRLRTISYNGTRGVIIAGSDMQMPPSPIQVRYDVSSNAGPYLNARLSVSGILGVPGTVSDRVVPAGTVGSVWMNPNTLVGFRQGELLDRDPVTGVETQSLGRQGNLVVLAFRTPLAQHTFGYDFRSGLLAQADLRLQLGPGTDITTLQLAGTE